ncbi:MAG: TonB-dependent receptor, partial [Sphingomonas sp.]
RRGDVAVDDEFRSTYVVGGALDYRGADVRLSLDVAYQRYKVTQLRTKVALGGLTAIPRVPRASANYSQAFSYSTLRDVFGTVKGEWDVSENAMLYASFGARDGSERGIYDGITVTDATTGAATGSALFVPAATNNEAAQAGIRVKLAQGGISHEINLGGAANWQVFRTAYNFLGGFDGFATNLYATPQVALPGPAGDVIGGDLDDPFPITRTRLFSAFASDTIGLFDDRVLISGGLRLQRLQNKGYSYFGGGLTSNYETDAVTPVVGLVVKPVAGVSLYANRVEALTAGDIAGASFTTAIGAVLPISNAGQALSATKSKQYEVGAKFTSGRFNASIAAFTTDRPLSFARPDPNRPGTAIFARFGKQRNRGIELSVDGELTEGLRVIAGGSIIDAALRETGTPALDGNDAFGVPKYLANANVEYDLPFAPGLTLTGRMVHTGRQAVDAANTLRLNDWTRFDVGARFVAAVAERPLTLRIGMDNVANRRYWASSFDGFTPQLLQGAPRTYRASASIDF